MPNLNEIKSSINNIKGTQKITKAMYLISASKSKAARLKLEKTRYHFNQLMSTLADILTEIEDYDTAFTSADYAKDAERDLYLVVAGDKGQAGGYNYNVIHFLEKYADKATSDVWVAGSMGRSLIVRRGYNVSPDFKYPVFNPNIFRAREVAELIVEAYYAKTYRKIFIVYTDMISALKLEPAIRQLLPLVPEDFIANKDEQGVYEKAEFEPDARSVFEHLVPHYLKGIIYGAFVDSFTCEQHARMFAMDNATKSANDMIASLSLTYNRVRQAKITQEITEIVGGIPTM